MIETREISAGVGGFKTLESLAQPVDPNVFRLSVSLLASRYESARRVAPLVTPERGQIPRNISAEYAVLDTRESVYRRVLGTLGQEKVLGVVHHAPKNSWEGDVSVHEVEQGIEVPAPDVLARSLAILASDYKSNLSLARGVTPITGKITGVHSVDAVFDTKARVLEETLRLLGQNPLLEAVQESVRKK